MMHDEARRTWLCNAEPRWLWQLGWASLMGYAAFRVLWPAVGSPAETLTALLGLSALMVYGKQLRYSVPLWLLGAAVLVQLLSWTLGYFHHPQWVADNPRLDRLGKLFIFIAVAWWLSGSTRRTFQLWGLALVGYVLASFVLGGGLAEWHAGLNGQRVGFGIRNHQHGAMLFGVVLLGMVVFAPRFLAGGPGRGMRALFWSLLTVIALVGVLIGQTRAVWLALSLALPLTLLLWLYHVRCVRQQALERRTLLIGLGIAIVVIGGLLMLSYQPLMERVSSERDVIVQLLNGEIGSIPYTSIGIRINTWMAAMEWIQQRPLTGWGGEARNLVIQNTPWLPEVVKQNFGHLHNFFLEMLVAYGILGLAVITTLAWWVARGTWLAWRGGVLPGDIALFGLGFFCYWMVVNQFESYNSFWTGVYVHNLILGGLVTHIWRWQCQAATAAENTQCER
ncbi:MAG TPA: O-antigen ligase family protein [Guyparkeria sp.]|nr:O-antigen ligase family protein [Guyparkeria sp.]